MPVKLKLEVKKDPGTGTVTLPLWATPAAAPDAPLTLPRYFGSIRPYVAP